MEVSGNQCANIGVCPGCVGYAYIPEQELNGMYCPETGLVQGTIFPQLDLGICEYGSVCKQWRGEEE